MFHVEQCSRRYTKISWDYWHGCLAKHGHARRLENHQATAPEKCTKLAKEAHPDEEHGHARRLENHQATAPEKCTKLAEEAHPDEEHGHARRLENHQATAPE